ncbi:MAG: exodeoxyribonuclease V subunit gamma [Kofleriaceae bacterium]
MLRAVHGNRLESLFAALVEALPPSNPFAPSTIITGSHLVTRWLKREIALARDIATGLDLVTFDKFIDRTWSTADGALVGIDQRQLAAAIASVLADLRVVDSLAPVAAYLRAAPAPGDRAGPRRVQLAEHLAQLVWQYTLTRPDWMAAFTAGRVPSELADDSTAKWQAALIGEAMKRLGASRDASDEGSGKRNRRKSKPPDGDRALSEDPTRVPIPMLPWARRRAGLPAPQLAAPIYVFGVSYLSRAQLEALTDLADQTDVTVYFLDPCAELWDDVSGRKRAKSIALDAGVPAREDPLLLSLWGKPMRDTLGALVERTSGDIDDAFVAEPPHSALTAMLGDVRQRAAAPSSGEIYAAARAGVSIVACSSERRELEAVAARLRAHLDADPSLRAHDLVVWIAGEPERYLAQASSAFEALGVPCHLVDAPLDDRGRIGEAVLALLELPTCSMTRSDLLRVMTHPAVLAGHPHVDAYDWVHWTERLGIVHGADARAHAGTYLEEHRDKFHWDQGVRRLALGAYMVGSPSRGAATIGDIAVAPEEVRPDQLASAATYALLVRSLCADAAWLATHEATLAEWAELFVGLVDAYIDRGGQKETNDTSRDLERVRSMLAGIARVDLDGRRVGFREAREHAVRRLVGARSDRGEPLAAGVMIAPLRAHRPIPFEIAAVVGLAEGSFPAQNQASPLDLRRDGRAGDVSPRDRDRHAFFDAVLGARRAMYLTYIAAEPKSGQPLGPSSVVLELGDALAPYLGASSTRAALDAITVREPLHRWGYPIAAANEPSTEGEHTSPNPRDSAVTITARDLPVQPAIERERWAVRVRDAIRAHLRKHGHPIPDADGMLELLAHPALAHLRDELAIVDQLPPLAAPPARRQLSLANLRAFLESPVQAWAQAVLDLDELPDDDVIDHSDEPFHVEKPARAILLREVLASFLADPTHDLARRYDRVVADLELRGQFPVGVFGEAARAVDLRTLDRWREELGMVIAGQAVRIGFGRSMSDSAELRPALELVLHDGRIVRLVGSTEILIRRGDRATSVIAMISAATGTSRHHLRGALDHVVLAAAGLAPNGHEHILLHPAGTAKRVVHDPWPQELAHAYLVELVTDLLDRAHGYLLPYDVLRRALEGRAPWTSGVAKQMDISLALGFGPIDKPYGLELPPDFAAMAKSRLGPLAERMHGDIKMSDGGGYE